MECICADRTPSQCPARATLDPAPFATRCHRAFLSVRAALRPCPVLDYKFIALGHNTIRGAAGVAILNAELMHREGLL